MLHWFITHISPTEISLLEEEAADPKSAAFTLTINVKQTSPIRPPRPLTLCTAHTILGEGDSSIRVTMRGRSMEKLLLSDPLHGFHMRYDGPKSDDWKTEMPFATIPGGDEGLTVTKTITWKRLLQTRGEANARKKTAETWRGVRCVLHPRAS
jgi:hypothetical protein